MVWIIKRNYVFHSYQWERQIFIECLVCERHFPVRLCESTAIFKMVWNLVLFLGNMNLLKNNWQCYFVRRRGKRKTIKLFSRLYVTSYQVFFMPDCPVILNSNSQILFILLELKLSYFWIDCFLNLLFSYILKIFSSSEVDFFVSHCHYIYFLFFFIYLFAFLPFVYQLHFCAQLWACRYVLPRWVNFFRLLIKGSHKNSHCTVPRKVW